MLTIMKTIKALLPFLPYLLTLILGVWGTHNYLSIKAELTKVSFDLATMTNRATTAEYSLEQERKFKEEQEKFRTELDKKFKEFDEQLSSYTQQLRGIASERNKSGVNNTLSEPVVRVLKDFTNTTNKN